MTSVSPVFTEQEVFAEQVIALDQPEYLPIIVARIQTDNFKASVTRYRFSDEERQQIAAGADILVYQPHLGAIMPLAFALAHPGQYPTIEGE
jgi:hypothetical protein